MAGFRTFVFFLILLTRNSAFEDSSDRNIGEYQVPYIVSNITISSQGILAYANFRSRDPNVDLKYRIQHLKINITYDTPDRVRIKITDAEKDRWEVPSVILPYNISGINAKYEVIIDENPFGILVIRKSDGKIIFNLEPSSQFRYNDQDINFINNVGYDISVMGFGERISSFVLNQGQYTLWSRDRCSPLDDGQNPSGNMYSMHPFYLAVDQQMNSFGGFLLNSNAMTAFVGNNWVGYRTTGGIIDY